MGRGDVHLGHWVHVSYCLADGGEMILKASPVCWYSLKPPTPHTLHSLQLRWPTHLSFAICMCVSFLRELVVPQPTASTGLELDGPTG